MIESAVQPEIHLRTKRPRPPIDLDTHRRTRALVRPCDPLPFTPAHDIVTHPPRSSTVDPSLEGSIQLNEAQLPIVGLLILTQSAVGIFILHALLKAGSTSNPLSQQYMVSAGLSAGVAALALSLYQRTAAKRMPNSRWRARTLLAFGIFLASATAYSSLMWGQTMNGNGPAIGHTTALQEILLLFTAVSGGIGIFASSMVCASARRPTWALHISGCKFALTTLMLGLAVAQLVLTTDSNNDKRIMAALSALMLCVITKGCAEYHFLKGRKARRTLHLRRSVRLLTHHLGWMTRVRIMLALICGFLLPMVALLGWNSIPAAWIILAGLLTEEFFERYQFFACTCTASSPWRSTA